MGNWQKPVNNVKTPPFSSGKDAVKTVQCYRWDKTDEKSDLWVIMSK